MGHNPSGVISIGDILARLPSLSPEELATLEQRLKALRSLGGTTSTPVNTHAGHYADSMVYNAIRAVLKPTGLPSRSQEATFNSTRHDDRLRLVNWARAQVDSHEEAAMLLQIGFEQLREYLARANVPVTASNLARNSDKVAALINRAFPGYAKAKLLSWLMKGELRDRYPAHTSR